MFVFGITLPCCQIWSSFPNVLLKNAAARVCILGLNIWCDIKNVWLPWAAATNWCFCVVHCFINLMLSCSFWCFGTFPCFCPSILKGWKHTCRTVSWFGAGTPYRFPPVCCKSKQSPLSYTKLTGSFLWPEIEQTDWRSRIHLCILVGESSSVFSQNLFLGCLMGFSPNWKKHVTISWRINISVNPNVWRSKRGQTSELFSSDQTHTPVLISQNSERAATHISSFIVEQSRCQAVVSTSDQSHRVCSGSDRTQLGTDTGSVWGFQLALVFPPLAFNGLNESKAEKASGAWTQWKAITDVLHLACLIWQFWGRRTAGGRFDAWAALPPAFQRRER